MLKKIINNPVLNLAVRILLGLIFVIAAVSKISDPASFAMDITNYGILPDFLINLMAITLPWIELICGIFLLSGILLKSSSAVSLGLYIIFICAVGIALIKGLNINCGCHAKFTTENVSLRKLLENTGLLALSFYLYFFPNKKFTIENLIVK
ncbi:MAG: MauE/DoxX family redox-associated membrane protein [FCB group bacterium]|jgi:uncharacterized membrane protein YphA (DoxX/SURF4 family)